MSTEVHPLPPSPACLTRSYASRGIKGGTVIAEEVIERSEHEKRLLGAPDYGCSSDWMLGQLAKLAGSSSLPALRRWMAVPRPDAVSPQQATSCFLSALRAIRSR
jgi:hypothetical protein